MPGGPTLYFVRHGETDWNAQRRLQGQTDTDLNEIGRQQAARNGRILRELVTDPDRVDFIASPLRRTRQTMEIIRHELGLSIDAYRIDDRLKEINFGHWEGLSWSELPGHDPDGYRARLADSYSWRPTGGESYADLMIRVKGWLAELQGDAVVVSHGGISRVLRGHLLGLPPLDIPELHVPQDKVLVLRRSHMAWY